MDYLYEYGERYESWAADIRRGDTGATTKFVVADITGGGFGNQLLQAIQGLIIAIETRRALVIYSVNTREEAEIAGMQWHPAMAQRFSFDSVLPLIPAANLSSLGWPDKASTFHVDLHSADGLNFVTCADWSSTLAPYRFAKACPQPPSRRPPRVRAARPRALTRPHGGRCGP